MDARSARRSACSASTALLGVGGMGEVYRARDTKLNRDVASRSCRPRSRAIPSASRGSSAKRRCWRRSIIRTSARFTGSRTQAESTRWCWSWWKGRRSRTDGARPGLRRGLPIDEALAIATPDLRRARSRARAGDHPSRPEAGQHQGPRRRDRQSARLRARASRRSPEPRAPSSDRVAVTDDHHAGDDRRGMILGTAAYMSPEQAKGKTGGQAQRHLGVRLVLYEMLTGERPFEGEDVADTLAAILRAEPDWKALPTATPAGPPARVDALSAEGAASAIRRHCRRSFRAVRGAVRQRFDSGHRCLRHTSRFAWLSALVACSRRLRRIGLWPSRTSRHRRRFAFRFRRRLAGRRQSPRAWVRPPRRLWPCRLTDVIWPSSR